MPWVRIDLSAGRSEEQKSKTAKAVTDAIVEFCGCTPESVSIVFNDVTPENWAFGGRLLSETQKTPQPERRVERLDSV
jgi:4-oxalocrotonate tautomerase